MVPGPLTYAKAGNVSSRFFILCRPMSCFSRSSASRFRNFLSDYSSHLPSSVRVTSIRGDDASSMLHRSCTNIDGLPLTRLDLSACSEAFTDHSMLLISVNCVHNGCTSLDMFMIFIFSIMAVFDLRDVVMIMFLNGRWSIHTDLHLRTAFSPCTIYLYLHGRACATSVISFQTPDVLQISLQNFLLEFLIRLARLSTASSDQPISPFH